MAVWHNFPYSNLHELNLDFLIKAVREVQDNVNTFEADVDKSIDDLKADVNQQLEDILKLLNDDILQYVEQYVDNHLSQFVVKATYNETTRTITLNEGE